MRVYGFMRVYEEYDTIFFPDIGHNINLPGLFSAFAPDLVNTFTHRLGLGLALVSLLLGL